MISSFQFSRLTDFPPLAFVATQQMWRYLEPLFIHSDEVKKELPLDTKRFEKIDGEVKATLMELWKVKKVKTYICTPWNASSIGESPALWPSFNKSFNFWQARRGKRRRTEVYHRQENIGVRGDEGQSQ